MLRQIAVVVGLACAGTQVFAQSALSSRVDALAQEMEAKVIEWRRDIHQHPELGNREVRTAKLVADHLRKLGIDVRTEVGVTGVVGLLKGGKPGPVVALRADMDALPVTEQTDVPFASKAKAMWEGKEAGVMHACGHDTHVAMLMGAAEMFARMRDELPGTVKFIFQPAEEGLPQGEEGGAALMIKQGALADPKPDAIFGLHVAAMLNTGKVWSRGGPIMAAADVLRIKVKGRQTHGAAPWGGVDPIVVASQIVMGLQTIVSRQVNLLKEPAVVTIGSIHGGNRFNIIPDEVEMVGTVRALDETMRDDIHRRIKQIAEMIAQSAGATAEVQIDKTYPVTVNNDALVTQMLPTVQRVAGTGNVSPGPKVTGAEDFAFYLHHVPGVFYFIGITPPGSDMSKVAFNHSPRFFVDEAGLELGVRLLGHLTIDYMQSNQ